MRSSGPLAQVVFSVQLLMLNPNTGRLWAEHVRNGVGGIAWYDIIYDRQFFHRYGNTICYEFLSFFVSLNVSFHYAVLLSVGLIHVSSIVSSYVLLFVLYIISSLFYISFHHYFIIVSYIVSIIYMYEHIVYIVDTELYCSLASL